MRDKYELKDLQTYKEEGMWYMSATYTRENDTGIYEIIIPKIALMITKDPIIKTPITTYKYFGPGEFPTIDLGFGDQIIMRDVDGILYYEKLIEEKIHDLTLDEIEKKLGFKVRVVSNKEM